MEQKGSVGPFATPARGAVPFSERPEKGTAPSKARVPILILAELAVIGISLALCPSRAEAFYMAVVPGFLVYAALNRHSLSGRLLWRHVIYFAVIGLAAVGGLLALARITPHVSISAAELAVTVCFLAAIYILLMAGDQIICAGLSRVFGEGTKGRRHEGTEAKAAFGTCRSASLRPSVPWSLASFARTALRVLVLVAVGGPFVMAALATHWPKFTDTSNPQELRNFRYEPAAFDATDGVHLRGWFIPTQGGDSDTTVIIVPARGMSKAAFLPYAGVLAGDWFNVLLVDQRGEGDSDGHTRGFGVLEARDVVGAVDYLREARPRASCHVFALGVSEGASAVLAGARADPRIEAVIVDSAFPNPAADLQQMMPPLPWPLDQYFQKATLLAASAQLGCNLFESGADRDIAAISPRPVLVIRGQADETVSADEAEELYSAAGNPVMLWQVRGAGHAESLSVHPGDYSHVVCNTLRYVRLGMPAFHWVHKPARRSRIRGKPLRQVPAIRGTWSRKGTA